MRKFSYTLITFLLFSTLAFAGKKSESVNKNNSDICCEYSCGYIGCKYKKLSRQDCKIVGGSVVSDDKCEKK